jgi:CubicO group peptidase (beta-lactamase class C family)
MMMSSIEIHGGHARPSRAWSRRQRGGDPPDAQAGEGAIRSTANDMLRYLKANGGIDQSALPR